MRLCLCIATLAIAAASPAAADTITLSFAGLAGQDGATVYYYQDQGITLSSALGFTVVGASSPYYTGAVGLAPIGASWAIVDGTGTPLAPAADGPLSPSEVALWVAAAGAPSYALTIAGFAGVPPAAVWQDDETGALGATPVQVFAGSNGPLATIVTTASIAPYQITELDLSTGLAGGTDRGSLGSGGGGGGGGGGAAPEPAAALLLLIGLVVAAAAARMAGGAGAAPARPPAAWPTEAELHDRWG